MKRHDWAESDAVYFDGSGFWDTFWARWDYAMDNLYKPVAWFCAVAFCILVWVHWLLPLIGRLFD